MDMDFFDATPPPDMQHGQIYRQPAWLAPQENALPKLVDLQLVAAQTDGACVVLRNFLAYREGWSFDLITLTKVPDMSGGMHGMFAPPGFPGMPEPDQMLRFGFRFADGTKVTNQSFMS